ncbi:peptide/nickel transport system permease protein [Paenibacillus endophyticus]|uniref:Peptide/nickel transport system permease protein n=1 Tax=Paenibacillus endophyticus TaxID=1294268 RepID=A0A7W5C9A9_9BACL|nr:ABC transporter permease [Paenibacillus endophyticus]MBB3153120.1 peptide/nickel transport system permease protein [Paenibacillus endophyticus]
MKQASSVVTLNGANRWNERRRTFASTILAAIFLAGIAACSWLLGSSGLSVQLENRNLAPSMTHLFGTDWLGRDMLSRTVKGLALSIKVGLLGAACSVVIAATMGLMAATLGRTVDRMISWLIDVCMSVPHLVMLILIAFVCGGGLKGIAIGIMLTHWPSLARIIRAEAMQLMAAEYVLVARKLGSSRLKVAIRHLAPHLLPQLLVGFLVLFPHAVLHEAAITFLGLGMSPHQPAIGIILSESMRYLSTGMWWLAVFPGLGLLLTVRAFDKLGNHLRQLVDPRHTHL